MSNRILQARPNVAAARPPRWLKALASFLLAAHILAVFVGPWALPPTGSQLAGWSARMLRPYLEVLSLDNGYRFFAPDPGPSHLIRYVLELPDGTRREATLPSLAKHWPRLLYHRHFMLSEFMDTISSGPEELAEPVAAAYLESYARHLLHASGARRVTMYLREHDLPSMRDVRRGMKLTDPSLYQEKRLGTFEAGKI